MHRILGFCYDALMAVGSQFFLQVATLRQAEDSVTGGGPGPLITGPLITADLVARSTWFSLASGLASILGLLLALYGTQIRTLPFSLYRSLTWRRALLLSFGLGLLVFAGINFYEQDPPPTYTYLRVVFVLLHGGMPQYSQGPGTSLWAVLILVGIGFLIWGYDYDPVARLRSTLVEEYAALHKARAKQLEEITAGTGYDDLSARDKNIYQQVLDYYADVQVRFLDALLGPAPPVLYHRSLLNPPAVGPGTALKSERD